MTVLFLSELMFAILLFFCQITMACGFSKRETIDQPTSVENSLSPEGECFGDYQQAYIRVSGIVDFETKHVAKTDMVTCTSYCRRNVDPSGIEHFPCQGFNFHAGRVPTCEFFPVETEDVKEPQWTEQDFSYYFEKTCLKVPQQCEMTAFVFDVRRNQRLQAEATAAPPEINTPARCQDECLREECKAFEFDRKNRKCSFYTATKDEADFVQVPEVDYYENNCLALTSRCAGGRVDFFVVRKSDVASFGISAGIRSVRNCMRECVESTLFFCRSFQFDPNTNECFISDESSDVAVPSSNLDLYEPFCLPVTLEPPCNRPYAFEKSLTTKLLYSKEINTVEDVGVEPCLAACVGEKYCRAVNYDVRNRNCTLLQNQVRVEGARTGQDENYDYYELACEPTQLVATVRAPSSRVIDYERAIKSEYRNLQHVHIVNFDDCRSACEKAMFGCKTFAYSPAKGECHLSSEDLQQGNENFEKQTIMDKEFDLYKIERKKEREHDHAVIPIAPFTVESVTVTVLPDSTFPTLVREKFLVTDPDFRDVSKEDITEPVEAGETPSIEEQAPELDNGLQAVEDIFDVPTSTLLQPPTTLQSTKTSTSVSHHFEGASDSHHEALPDSVRRGTPTEDIDFETSFDHPGHSSTSSEETTLPEKDGDRSSKASTRKAAPPTTEAVANRLKIGAVTLPERPRKDETIENVSLEKTDGNKKVGHTARRLGNRWPQRNSASEERRSEENSGQGRSSEDVAVPLKLLGREDPSSVFDSTSLADNPNSSSRGNENSEEERIRLRRPPPRRRPQSSRASAAKPPNVSAEKANEPWKAVDPEKWELEDNAVPRVIPLTANVGYVPANSVHVRADCHENGVNITFDVDRYDYTGVVYAAERFSQCRIFVKKAKQFAIFVPRPAHNTWCNALEVDGQLSAVIVMSNDRVLPHDVTTKDDLFYQVTCNYSTEIKKVQSGIVVGGPSPVSIKSRQSRSFSLQIMQQGEPVESVFIGEKLTARVQSDIQGEKLRITECTATRVGGEVTPATVQLIADGCALMPSIMGPMKMVNHGWEAALNAFRIDGSEQIDIVCLVVVCQEEKCPEVNITCPASRERSARSLMSSGEPIRVDHRLKPFEEPYGLFSDWGESAFGRLLPFKKKGISTTIMFEVLGGDRQSYLKDNAPLFPEVCVQPSVYLSTLFFLFCTTAALVLSILTSIRKRKLLEKTMRADDL